jgi:hypothetical protein
MLELLFSSTYELLEDVSVNVYSAMPIYTHYEIANADIHHLH